MKLPDTHWRSRAGMRPLLAALGADQGDTRFVGGAIRDTLLGIGVNDVDLATRLAPETVLERLEAARIKAVPTGLAHGTITAIVGAAAVGRDVARPSPLPTTGARTPRGATSRSTLSTPTRRQARSSIISAASTIWRRAASASSAIP